jgi:phage-related minor tail protein
MVTIGVDTTDLTEGTADAAQEANRNLADIGKTAAGAAAGAAVGALFAEGFSEALELNEARAKLQSEYGLSEDEAARAGESAGRVYAGGFGESVSEVGDAVGVVQQALGGMGKMSNETLDQMTADAMMLSSTFEIDVADSAQAAGTMIKNGMAKDGTEAFDILTKAAQTLPKSMRDDIVPTINEYSEQFQRLGIDGKTAFGMLSQFVKAGGRDFDQAADVIHEFGRITTENTAQAATAFKSLGLDSDDMFKRLKAGGDSAKCAMGDAITAIGNVQDPAKRAQLAVQLFGDMAGESSDALLAMNPATAAAASGMDKAGGAAKAASDKMAASQSLTVIWRSMATTIAETLQPALAMVAGFVQDHPEAVKILAAALLGMGVAFSLAAIAVWAMNSAMLANPIFWIIGLVVLIIAIIIALAANWEAVKLRLLAVWEDIKAAFSAGWNYLKANVFGPIAQYFTQTLPGYLQTGIGFLKGKWNDLIGWFQGIPGRISRALHGMWDGLKTSFKSAVNGIIGAWNNLSFTIGGGSIMGVDIPSITLGTPNIPYLASGGVTTGPTMAMIGEGRENEAVLPLSKLDGMLRTASVQGAGGAPQRLVLDVTGSDEDMKRLIRRIVKTQGRGSVQTAFG